MKKKMIVSLIMASYLANPCISALAEEVNHGDLTSKVVEGNNKDTSNVYSNEAPKINGVKDITIKVGDVDTFDLLKGITVTDNKDKDLKPTVSGSLKKPAAGRSENFKITYTVTDSDSNTTIANRIITVTNYLPTIDGLTDLTIKRGETVNLRTGVTANDFEDGSLTKKIVFPNIDLKTLSIGKHEILYEVTDSNGNTTIKKRIVNVVANPMTKFEFVGNDRYETAVKVSKEGWNGSNNIILVSGNNANLVDGIAATPLASSLYAPILLTSSTTVPNATIDEIKRLKATNIIVIGGENAISKSVIDQLKSINPNITVKRISGKDRYETSLNIAKEVDSINPIRNIFVSAGNGEADALSIASVAGRDKSPIILTPKNGLDNDTYNYLRTKNLLDAYFVGGTTVISNKVIEQVNGIVSKEVSGNRISGMNRKETNANVIKRFYPDSVLKGAIITKDLNLIDALTVGPFAAWKGIPVILGQDSLSKEQEDVLKNKVSNKLYKAGGGVSSSVIERLESLLAD